MEGATENKTSISLETLIVSIALINYKLAYLKEFIFYTTLDGTSTFWKVRIERQITSQKKLSEGEDAGKYQEVSFTIPERSIYET